MIIYCKRAVKDILDHRFLNILTIITIAVSILIASAFALFLVNANDIATSWKKGIKIMAYLKPDVRETDMKAIKQKIKNMNDVRSVRFISKEAALQQLKHQMKRHASLLDNLKDNPLPNAFEIQLSGSSRDRNSVETMAVRLESLSEVDEVEYGQVWIGRFIDILNIFRLTGYVMGGLFFLATILIVANTIRLVLYSRREEVEIMRLVGATDGFIKTPFYLEGLIQGALGGLIALVLLFVIFLVISSSLEKGLASALLTIRFLSIEAFFGILLLSMSVGWLGCYLSLKQFLK